MSPYDVSTILQKNRLHRFENMLRPTSLLWLVLSGCARAGSILIVICRLDVGLAYPKLRQLGNCGARNIDVRRIKFNPHAVIAEGFGSS